MWRFRTFRHITFDPSLGSKLDGLGPRMRQILLPIIAVSRDYPEFHEELKRYFGKYAADQRADSPDALVVEAIKTLMGDAKVKTLSVKDVAQCASEIRQSQEPQAAVDAAKVAIQGSGEDPQYFSARRAGGSIKRLGFKTKKERDGARTGWFFEVTRARLDELASEYGLPGQPGRVGF
jgi:hypothetical protein